MSRSARGEAPAIRWIGHADGTFEVIEIPEREIEVGTTMRLLARTDTEHWLSHESVLALAIEYGSLLPFDVAVRVPIPGAAPVWRRITQAELPWEVEHARALDRERALAAHCERSFGFTPLAAIDLTLSGSPVRCSASSGEPVTRCGRSSRRSRASPPPARNSNAPTPRAS